MRVLNIISLLLLLALAACGNSQEIDGDGSPQEPATDSIITEQIPEKKVAPEKLKQTIRVHLRDTDAYFRNAPKKDPSNHLIAAEYALFNMLTTVALALDIDQRYSSEIKSEEKRFRSEDSTRPGKAGKITNGMLGIHAMYSLLFKMRFQLDDQKMARLESLNDSVIRKMNPGTPAIVPVAIMAVNSYRIVSDIMHDIDKDSLYSSSFAQIETQFRNGMKASTTEEDQFLNGIYRTFEISQLWALFLDPAARSEISEINKSLLSSNARAEGIGEEMALGVEYLYKICRLIARKTVEVTLQEDS